MRRFVLYFENTVVGSQEGRVIRKRPLMLAVVLISLSSHGDSGGFLGENIGCLEAVNEVNDYLIMYRDRLVSSEISYKEVYEDINSRSDSLANKFDRIEYCSINKKYPEGLNSKAGILSDLGAGILSSVRRRSRTSNYDDSDAVLVDIKRAIKFSSEVLSGVKDYESVGLPLNFYEKQV